MQVGNLVLEGKAFHLHRTLDVAVALIHQDCVSKLEKEVMLVERVSDEMVEGSYAIVCGYPKTIRIVEGKVIDFDLFMYGSPVSAASHDHFRLQSHLDEEVAADFQFDTNRDHLSDEVARTDSMGGISGGPVFQLVERKNKVGQAQLQLSGIVVQCHENIGQFVGVPVSAFRDWMLRVLEGVDTS